MAQPDRPAPIEPETPVVVQALPTPASKVLSVMPRWLSKPLIMIAGLLAFILALQLLKQGAKVYGGDSSRVPLVAPHPVSIRLQRGANERIIARVLYNGPVPAPIKQGQQIGTLKVWRNDKLALQVPLRAGADIGTGNLPRRAFDAATEFVIGLFRAGIQRL